MVRRTALLLLLVTAISSLAIGSTPEWMRGYPLYEVWVRAQSPEGTFEGFRNQLGTLRDLGISNLWLMPIYPIGIEGRKGEFGSPYAVRDYMKVNPEFGDSASFQALVTTVHEQKMHVILDWVANHSANDHVLMKSHPEWWMHDKEGKFTREVPEWSDVTDFNYDNPAMRTYMTDALKLWQNGFGVDGFRFDVAGLVPADYWKAVLFELRKTRPDAFYLAEAYGDEYAGLGFNSKYDWPLYHALVANAKGTFPVDSVRMLIADTERKEAANFFIMRFLENHDEQRAAKVFGKEKLPAYIGLIFGLPGVPLLYSGQEIGTDKKPSIFEKEAVDWNNVNVVLYDKYRYWVQWRNKLPSLRTGSLAWFETPGAEKKAMAFSRTEGNQTSVIVTNLSADPVSIKLSGILPNGMNVDELKEALSESLYSVSWKNDVTIRLQPWSARLFVAEK